MRMRTVKMKRQHEEEEEQIEIKSMEIWTIKIAWNNNVGNLAKRFDDIQV